MPPTDISNGHAVSDDTVWSPRLQSARRRNVRAIKGGETGLAGGMTEGGQIVPVLMAGYW